MNSQADAADDLGAATAAPNPDTALGPGIGVSPGRRRSGYPFSGRKRRSPIDASLPPRVERNQKSPVLNGQNDGGGDNDAALGVALVPVCAGHCYFCGMNCCCP